MNKMSDPIPLEKLKLNLERIHMRMGEAAAKASRPLSAIKLVAVTKYVTLHEIEALIQLGVRDFGESRVQDAEQKIKALPPAHAAATLNWHLIGHLQTNKADKAAALFQTIHSVDSDRVAAALNKEAAKRLAKGAATEPITCLLEVNVAHEANKFGLKPESDEIETLLKKCAEMPAIRIVGLMAMAPYAENPEPTSRPVFQKLHELFQQANASGWYPYRLTELSMGMTQDYHIGIEEGATLIRVGSALFEQ